MHSRLTYLPPTAEEAENAILEFLSSDGNNETLHQWALAGLRFLEQDRSSVSIQTHKMRMAVKAWRTEKITAKLGKTS